MDTQRSHNYDYFAVIAVQELTVHRVEGVGRPLALDTSQEFHPRMYERAIHGLQELILKVWRLEGNQNGEDYTPGHEVGEQQGEALLHVYSSR